MLARDVGRFGGHGEDGEDLALRTGQDLGVAEGKLAVRAGTGERRRVHGVGEREAGDDLGGCPARPAAGAARMCAIENAAARRKHDGARRDAATDARGS